MATNGFTEVSKYICVSDFILPGFYDYFSWKLNCLATVCLSDFILPEFHDYFYVKTQYFQFSNKIYKTKALPETKKNIFTSARDRIASDNERWSHSDIEYDYYIS